MSTNYDDALGPEFSEAVSKDAKRQVREGSLPGALDYWKGEVARLRDEEKHALAEVAKIHAAQSDPHAPDSGSTYQAEREARLAEEAQERRAAAFSRDAGSPQPGQRIDKSFFDAGGVSLEGRSFKPRPKHYRPTPPWQQHARRCETATCAAIVEGRKSKRFCPRCIADRRNAAKRAGRAASRDGQAGMVNPLSVVPGGRPPASS
jgi:hypothetical protein